MEKVKRFTKRLFWGNCKNWREFWIVSAWQLISVAWIIGFAFALANVAKAFGWCV